MVLTFEELLSRLKHPRNSMSEELTTEDRTKLSLEVRTLRQGRTKGQPNYDEDVRVAAGALARLIGPVEVARETGMSEANASYLKRAYSSSADKHQELNEKIEDKLNTDERSESEPLPSFGPPGTLWEKPKKTAIDLRIADARESALATLVQSIKEITPESLQNEKPKILASIAKDMASIVNLTGNNGNGYSNAVRVVIATVPQKTEEHYDIVQVEM